MFGFLFYFAELGNPACFLSSRRFGRGRRQSSIVHSDHHHVRTTTPHRNKWSVFFLMGHQAKWGLECTYAVSAAAATTAAAAATVLVFVSGILYTSNGTSQMALWSVSFPCNFCFFFLGNYVQEQKKNNTITNGLLPLMSEVPNIGCYCLKFLLPRVIYSPPPPVRATLG